MAHADPATGLSAAAVAERRARGLVNEVPPAPTRTVAGILRANVITPINIVIGSLAALVIAAGSPKDALFGSVIVANSVVGIVQELRAKRVLDRLSVLQSPRVRVVRDGELITLHSADLVLDDVVELRSGDQVMADGEMLATEGLELDESLLTGEADPVAKSDGDTVLSGSAVVAGTGRMAVTRIGADHYAARLAEEARRFTLVDSALRNDINRIVAAIGYGIVPIGLLLASSQFLRRDDGWRESVVSTVAGLVGMVPEGLVLLTSVAFAVGIVRLAARRCLVQELPAIEVLARVDVLCVDKTGTITAGSLSVRSVEPLNGSDADTVRQVLGAMAHLDPDPNPTSAAIAGFLPGHRPSGIRLVDRVPFSSQRKWSAMTLDPLGTWVLGAPERLLVERTDVRLSEAVARHAADGRRVLVLAEAADPAAWAAARADDHLPPVEPRAIVLVDDVIRPDAPDTLAWFDAQGVSVKVISGDSPATVGAIARRAGLRDADRAVSADSLPEQGSDEFSGLVERTTVFGRVDPHVKRALVTELQRRGHTVAMTGDGVNDVLALKQADCGIAMASGSEATRAVAQLVLLDSTFSSLPAVVAEGRRVINNIERVASLFLAKTTYSVVLSLLTGVIAVAYPLRPIHLSILSWFTIGLPAFFLALEANDQRVNEGFLRRVLGRAVPAGLVIAVLTMSVFGLVQLEPSVDPDQARTAAVLVAGSVALMNLFRTALPLTRMRAVLVTTMTAAFGLAFAVPALRSLFELPATSPRAYATALGAAVAAWPLLAFGARVAHRWGDG